jgi:type I restriction enzyme S subunit
MVAIRADHEKIDPRYLFAVLRSSQIQGSIDRMHVGTMIPHFKKGDFNKLLIPIPSRSIQEFIGEAYMTLVRKIELNRLMNESLEASARAIFKDWFVDFGPTRAKMAGSRPYLPPHTWSHFPDQLDDGGVPKGWTSGTLDDLATQAGESVSPEEVPPDTPYIGLEHMPRRSVALDKWGGAAKVTSGKLKFKRGDFLFGKLRPYFHKVGIAPLAGICSTDIVVLNARIPAARSFVISCISQDDYVSFTERTSDGTKMPRTSWGRMKSYTICVPSPETLEHFEQAASPLFERIVSNVRESSDLTIMRDLLLAEFMSGRFVLRDAEKIVGETI